MFIILILIILFAKRSERGESSVSSMSEKDLQDNVKRLAISLRSGEIVGSIPNINAYLSKIKKAYKTVLGKVAKSRPLYECEKWLYENYYSATINVKQSDYKVFSRLAHKKNNVRIIQLARFMVSSSNCNVTAQSVRQTVSMFNDYTPLHYEEVLNLNKALAYALIEKIAEVSEEIVMLEKLRRHAEGDLEPVRRLCKYDAYLYYFKHAGKYLDEKYFYKINDINPDNIDVSFSNNLVDFSVLISNCISSMKRLEDIFSEKFTLQLCPIYSIMAQDEIYRNMDMCSQYAYINAVSKLSSLYGASERSVTKSAMELAKIYNVHFGEIIYDYRYAIKGHIHSITPSVLKQPTTKGDQRLYAIVIALLSLTFTVLSVVFLKDWRLMILMGVLMPIVSIPPAKFVVSLIIDTLLPSRNVSAMNYIDLPEEGRTLVVKNEYISSVRQAKEACENLLALAKSNKDDMLEYALLVDLNASDKEVDERDGEIIRIFDSMKEFPDINVFVRKRVYIDGKWKAYERKRGATDALNKALSDGNYGKFAYVLREQKKPNFVLLLDEDNTVLPGGIKQAVNTMLHPLNKKYTLMTFRSRYRLSSLTTAWSGRYKSDSGVDGYCNYGDFYYKISGNAIYCGKGIYRLDEYVRQIEGKLPENRILSHDIIEGAIVSTGSLAIPTYEDAPKTFVSHNVRENRWQRGDLLLMPYIFSSKVSQPFYRYVMAYNVVRTVLPVYRLAILATLALSANPLLLIAFSISELAVWLIRFGLCLNALNYDKRTVYVVRQLFGEIATMLYEFVMLPFYATESIMLWLKMIYKLVFARKTLLDWKTFYSSQRASGYSKHVQMILISCILSIILGAIFYTNIYILAYFALYIVIANLTYFTARERDGGVKVSNEEDRKFLCELADKTCGFFERNLKDNRLICDNYQIFPKKGANSFTSPTNIGFSLMYTICAYKLGKTDISACLSALSDQIDTVERLDKYKGHLYNWYSLATHKPLYPYFVSSVDSGNFIACLITVKQFVKDADNTLYKRISELIAAVDFDALFDGAKGKFHIGYNKAEEKFEGHYDMLASESRTLCYIASCINSDTRYWNGLARNIVKIGGNTLVSWSGTAFEYLMPQIFLRDCKGSLLSVSIKNAVKIMSKARCKGVWGISESCYYEFNEENQYKYAAFGVSSISLSASNERCVISPYASALALKYAPRKAADNLQELTNRGLLTNMGMYEAVDYTGGDDLVATLMAHHQGMTLCSIVNTLFDNYLVDLFMSDRAMDGGSLLLEEQIPTSKSKKTKKFDFVYSDGNTNDYRMRGECKVFPRVNALTNGHYSCITDSYGNGYSFSKGKYLNKFTWNAYDNKGGFFYISDGKELFSPTYAPFRKDNCTFTFKPFVSEFENIDRACAMSVYIPQNANCEVRKVTLTNNDNAPKIFKCGYCEEVALTDYGALFSHPAFNDMFVSTSYDSALDTLIAKRTSRSYHGDCYSSLTVLGMDNVRYESNLFNFIGRNRTFTDPIIFEGKKPYGVSVGDVLNPCLGFVGEIEVGANSQREILCVKFYDSDINALKSNVEQCRMADFAKYSYESARLTLLSKTYKYQRNEKISELICRIASNIVYRPYDRDKLMEMANNFQDRLPMSLNKAEKYVYFAYYNQDETLRNLVYATIYLNMASVKHTLVIAYWAKDGDNERALKSFVDLTNVGDILDLECIRFLRLDGMDAGTVSIIKANAFAVVDVKPEKGNKDGSEKVEITLPELNIDGFEEIANTPLIYGELDKKIVKKCGSGGFDADGNYVVDRTPPLPYSNVICAECGGFVVTDNGGGFDYFGNSNLNRTTLWENNPVFDSPCEELYIYLDGYRRINKLVKGGFVRHSIGCTSFEGKLNDIQFCLQEGLIGDGKAKTLSLELVKEKGNISTKVLFRLDAMMSDIPHRQMIFDEQIDSRTIKITNAFNNRSVFIRTDVDCKLIARREHMQSLNGAIRLREGKCNYYNASHSLLTDELSGRKINVRIIISEDYGHLQNLDINALDVKIFEQRTKFDTLNRFELCSKDENLDLLFNKWLPYQVVSSRINGKCGYYQAGGAIGFRDQLQDMQTMLYIRPERVKDHILLSAEHQYLEGDVQHWWHGDCFGVRTQIRDDRLFLAQLTFEYIDFTGDKSILNCIAKYLISAPLPIGEEARLETPEKSAMGESLLSHIRRAIDATLQYGDNGLLLIGGGDWNDALNEIGMQNKGESVWLSMFMVRILRNFVKYLDFDERQSYLAHIENLQLALDKCVKDGYFMRATTDGGERLGVIDSPHFTHDLLCQSWSVIANISSSQTQKSALQAVSHLVDGDNGIIRLLAPAQTKERYYGYISSYPTGVRENGGQYTHAAAWYVKAAAITDAEIINDQGAFDAHDLLNMINPVAKNCDEKLAEEYKGEPYVLAGDVYTNADNYGRMGWSWYTGSASVLYDTIIRDFLGITISSGRICFAKPKLKDWQDVKLTYRYKGSIYTITYSQGSEDGVEVDGILCKGDMALTLKEDLGRRQIKVVFR